MSPAREPTEAVEALDPLVPPPRSIEVRSWNFQVQRAQSAHPCRASCVKQRALAAGAGFCLLLAAAAVLAWTGDGPRHRRRSRALPTSEGKLAMERTMCDDAVKGEPCHRDIVRLMGDVEANPDDYPGLERNASLNSLQAFLYNHGRCPESCSISRSSGGTPAPLREGPGRGEAARGTDRMRGREKGRHEQECEQLAPDSVCLDNVEWVLKVGLFTHPEWYDGLSKQSTFQDVQAVLQHDPRSGCPTPCECHTARPGEACYDRVSWVLQTGLVEHPEWYLGLTRASTRKEVQAMLQKQFNGSPANSCQKPCNR